MKKKKKKGGTQGGKRCRTSYTCYFWICCEEASCMICHPGRKKRGTLLDNSDTHYMLEHSRRGDERINGDYMQGVRGEKGVKTRRKRERERRAKGTCKREIPVFFFPIPRLYNRWNHTKCGTRYSYSGSSPSLDKDPGISVGS